MSAPFLALGMRDLRAFIETIDEHGQLTEVSGAALDLEVGGLSKIARRDGMATALLFDDFADADTDARLVTNVLDTPLQVAVALGYEPTNEIREVVRAHKETVATIETRALERVSDAPILENVDRGEAVDLTRFPAPLWHEGDGGRYIGTGDLVVTRNASSGELNAGTYRVQVQGPSTATIKMEPGHDGAANRRSYLERDEPFPIAVSLGQQPDLFMAANERFPPDVNELEYVSAHREAPLEVVEGAVTDLPVPARAEVVLEGHVYPESSPIDEGPFGEWTGYYGSGGREELPFNIERLYYRDDPIIHGYNNVPVVASANSKTRSASKLWNGLEEAGVPGIEAVNTILPGVVFQVVSIEQQYPGHSTQAGMQAISLPSGVWEGRFTVIVDDDIDAYDRDEILWAITSRCDPDEDIQIVTDCVSSHLNPRMPPAQKEAGDLTNSRAILDATRPYEWRDEFPEDTKIDPDFEAELRRKFGETVFADSAPDDR